MFSLAFILSMCAGSSEMDTGGWLVMPVNHNITQTCRSVEFIHNLETLNAAGLSAVSSVKES